MGIVIGWIEPGYSECALDTAIGDYRFPITCPAIQPLALHQNAIFANVPGLNMKFGQKLMCI